MKIFQKITINNTSFFIKNFEDLIEEINIINFNETTVEIPGVLLWTTEKKSALYQFLNPGLEIFLVSEAEIKTMLDLLSIKKENTIIIKTHLKPDMNTRITLDNIFIYYLKITDTTIIVNNLFFTKSNIEFHGTGMFTGKINSFFIDNETFEYLKEFFKKSIL
jgi:hypothetical protein